MRHVTRHFRIVLVGLLTLTALSFVPVAPSFAEGSIRYVSPGGAGDCSGWASACDLQDALAQAAAQDEIWVAQGSYYPDQGTGQTDNAPTSSFTLPDGVALYGGFAGVEASRDQRDWTAHRSILSGDLEQNDPSDSGVVTDPNQITGSNAYHVVRSSGVTSSTVLDGFIVTAGDALPEDGGGGMFNDTSSPMVSNTIFTGNRAGWAGGGMFNNYGSATTLRNVAFNSNTAPSGGGMYNYASTPTLSNVTFTANTASNGAGAGMINRSEGNPILNNVTFSGNIASISGGGMYNQNSNPAINNSILWGDTAPEILNESFHFNDTPK